MDTVVVSMRCGGSGAPLRVVFARRSGEARYGIVSIEPGTGITVAVAPIGALPSPDGVAQISPMTNESVPRRQLAWYGFGCAICGVRGGSVYTCPSCGTFLCGNAVHNGAFRCPNCQFREKLHSKRAGWLSGARMAIGRRLYRRRAAADVPVSRFSGTAADRASGTQDVRRLSGGEERTSDESEDNAGH